MVVQLYIGCRKEQEYDKLDLEDEEETESNPKFLEYQLDAS
jgi:hypothetical protein